MVSILEFLKDIDDALTSDDSSFEELAKSALISYVGYAVTKDKNYDKEVFSAAVSNENISSLVENVKADIDKYVEHIKTSQKDRAAQKAKEDWNKRYAEAMKYMQQLEEEKKKIFSK